MNPEQRDAVLAHWIPTERSEHYGAHWEGGLAGNQYALIPTKRPSPVWTWKGEAVSLASVNLWTHTSEGALMDAPTLMDVRWSVEPPTMRSAPDVCDAAAIAHFTALGLVNVATARVEEHIAKWASAYDASRERAMEMTASSLKYWGAVAEGEASGYLDALEDVGRLIEGMEYHLPSARRGIAARIHAGLFPTYKLLHQAHKDIRRDADELERIKREGGAA